MSAKNYNKLRETAFDYQRHFILVSSAGIIRALVLQFLRMTPLERNAQLEAWFSDPEYRREVYQKSVDELKTLRKFKP